MPPSAMLDSLKTNGYVVVPGILDAAQLSKLREASARTVDLARSGSWPHIRTLPKQFPPWTSSLDDGIWGVQHLLHPDLPDNKLFADSYFGDSTMGAAKTLLQCDDDDLILELFNLLVRPDRDFELRWHRDDILNTATPEEELERLNRPAWHAQWNLALYDDQSLIVVPGSHARARTDVERNAGEFEPKLPGQLAVHLNPGDAVFYNNNILHRGVYKSNVERMTLHGSVGHVNGSKARARNVLQHGSGKWVDKIDFEGLANRTRAEKMRARLLELGRENPEVGYSQIG